MLRKLAIDAVQADLAAVEGLLALRSQEADPVGWFQFSKRKDSLRRQIAELSTHIPSGAAVGLFFGGLPVMGSRGIKAGFGARAVEQFQDVVTKRYAEHQGPLGSRGPTKQADLTELMITDVARGSFGFVLEEANDNFLLDSPLKEVVDNVVDLIYQTSAPDEEAFNAFAESVDPRVLSSLRSFFQLLDSEGATMRIVDDHREFSLARESIARGRTRTDTIEISEIEQEFIGKFYLLPESRRFELHMEDGSVIRGSVALEFLKSLLGETQEVPEGVLGTERTVSVRVRIVKFPNVPTKYVYRLMAFAEPTQDAVRTAPA
ncbi:hypothetical protein IVB02_21400 [Bradyrhizobium sp. 166]|uniref:hypothetical protein n=1 Tax=Bradyrhizobium sp. 166 TaxID=2782638 RepID=UPI001FFB0219|nr:hypothetical protein [Bradyrhizobium sp. 166]MCK1603923.1 hypothetical protein [Bradyrhizobium sp. 166]